MEVLDALYVLDGPAANALIFRINLGTPGAIDQIGFAHHVQEKFEGRLVSVERYKVPPHHLFGSVTVEFADEEAAEQARTFSSENLAESGMPRHAVRHEMKRADLRHREAEHLMRTIFEAPIRPASSPTDGTSQHRPEDAKET